MQPVKMRNPLTRISLGSGSPAFPSAAAFLRENRRGALQTAQLPPRGRAFRHRGHRGCPRESLGTQGDLLFSQPHPASSHSTSTWGEEQGRIGALLGGAGVLEYSGALQSKNPRNSRKIPGGVQSALERSARVLLHLPALEVSMARCRGTAPNHTPYRTLVPTLNPIADRLVPGLHPAEAQATDTPFPGAGTLVGSAKRGFYE